MEKPRGQSELKETNARENGYPSAAPQLVFEVHRVINRPGVPPSDHWPHLDQVGGRGHHDAQRPRREAGRDLEVQRWVALVILANVEVTNLSEHVWDDGYGHDGKKDRSLHSPAAINYRPQPAPKDVGHITVCIIPRCQYPQAHIVPSAIEDLGAQPCLVPPRTFVQDTEDPA